MSMPGPPTGWSQQGGGQYPGPPPPPPQYGPPPPGGPFPPATPAPPGRKSGPPVVLIVIATLVVLIGGGGGAYIATVSSGAYSTVAWACTLVPPSDSAALVPHGLPEGGNRPESGQNDSTCVWKNTMAVNVGLEKQSAILNVRERRYTRGLLSSAELNARQGLASDRSGSEVRAPGTPISGYGDEAIRVPKAYGGQFDAILFRKSNLVIEVAAEVDDHPGYQPELAWSRTQRAASAINQHLRTLPH